MKTFVVFFLSLGCQPRVGPAAVRGSRRGHGGVGDDSCFPQHRQRLSSSFPWRAAPWCPARTLPRGRAHGGDDYERGCVSLPEGPAPLPPPRKRGRGSSPPNPGTCPCLLAPAHTVSAIHAHRQFAKEKGQKRSHPAGSRRRGDGGEGKPDLEGQEILEVSKDPERESL